MITVSSGRPGAVYAPPVSSADARQFRAPVAQAMRQVPKTAATFAHRRWHPGRAPWVLAGTSKGVESGTRLERRLLFSQVRAGASARIDESTGERTMAN